MDEPVQLHDLTDGEHAYEMLPAPKNCDALTEPSTDGNDPAGQTERVDFSKPKPETGTVALRIVQIFCGLLLLMVIINSVAIGVLIQKLNSRVSEIEVDSKSSTEALKAIQQNGTKGDTGALGPTGPQGPPGTKGEQGSRGMKGDSGNPGTAGPKGDSGEKGTKGVAGALGPTGPQGPPGTKGEQGSRGMKGDSGNPGTAGPKGDSGEKGTKGDTGAFGPTGPQGPPGINGLHGLRGMKGDSGNPGTPGPKGDSGNKGLDGQKGERGLTGFKGDSGEKGAVGQKGQRGPAGLDAQTDYKSAFAIFHTEPTYDSSTKVLTFPETLLNIGNDYDTTTGQFTCRYPGIYVFLVNLYIIDGSKSVKCQIQKNGHTYTYAHASNSVYNEGSASTILRLKRGDKVDVGDCVRADNIYEGTSFIGFLLQAD